MRVRLPRKFNHDVISLPFFIRHVSETSLDTYRGHSYAGICSPADIMINAEGFDLSVFHSLMG
jgi:hypothetical protein